MLHDRWAAVLDVVGEMFFQDHKWGDQSHLADSPPNIEDHTYQVESRFGLVSGDLCRSTNESMFHKGRGSWSGILLEEVGEAMDEAMAGNSKQLREELVQVAAVAVQWIRAIDKREMEEDIDQP